MAAYKAFTQEWLDAWKEKIAGSAEYKEIAKDWEGSVSLIVNADPSKNVAKTFYFFLSPMFQNLCFRKLPIYSLPVCGYNHD